MLTSKTHSSIRKISSNRAEQKGIYRFLNNSKVTENALIEELCSRSSRLSKGRHVLCIQDTTEMNYFSKRHRIKDGSGFGRLDCAKPALGFKMHSTLMLDAVGGDLLGFSDVKIWHRPLDMDNRKERKYQSLPIEEKESYKWIEAVGKSEQQLKEALSITFVEDREGDIYEQLSLPRADNVHYVIRSKANRNTTLGTKAWEILKEQPDIGSYTISLPTDHRKRRIKSNITLNVRFAPILITKGDTRKNASAYPSTVALNIVEAYEDKPSGINWKLLTTHAITNFEEAYQIIEWYSQRWMIEQVHRLLKHKGFQIEDSELESGWAIRKLCVLMLSALLRIVQMNIAYSEPEGGQPVTDVFSPKEIECLQHINNKLQGKTLKLQNNNNPKNLKWATWIIARLGGWKGYDSQGPPGIILLKRGIDQFVAIFFGWQLAKDVGTQ